MNNRNEEKVNRLINEKSPYLLQHAYNPVDWYPWGEEAFNKAKAENKPVFLSIGYSTCHWCHVMEKDSFEDQEVADLLNEHFIAIKVDREERPDLDQKYMAACQALTGQGGWPLTVFLTPDQQPFYAATFIPKTGRYGMRGMTELLPKLSALWKSDRDKVVQAGNELTEKLNLLARPNRGGSASGKPDLPGEEMLERAYRQLAANFDREYAGFGDAPKFPSPHQLTFLLRWWKRTGEQTALDMVLQTLYAMYRGGIFDQLGYGIHRYSVDRQWLVPHFEKMLYDQGTTALAAVEAYQASGDEEVKAMAHKIFSYVLRDLTSPEGAFFSAEDADTEGREGTFYVWRPAEIIDLLGAETGKLINDYYGVTEKGNFDEQTTVLHHSINLAELARSNQLTETAAQKIIEESRQILLEARSRRIRPFRDDKIITAWNGMFITALARSAAVFKSAQYLEAAETALKFILNKMTAGGRLLRRYRDGEAAIPAFLDDYAWLVSSLLELYRAASNKHYLTEAGRLTGEMLDLFDAGEGILYFSAREESTDDSPLIAEAYDGATPSGVSVAAMNLLQLGRLLTEEKLYQKGEDLIKNRSDQLKNHPTGFTYLLSALDYALSPDEDLPRCNSDGVCR